MIDVTQEINRYTERRKQIQAMKWDQLLGNYDEIMRRHTAGTNLGWEVAEFRSEIEKRLKIADSPLGQAQIVLDQAQEISEAPAAAPKWNPIATAPKNASEMRVKMRDGMIHEKAHWAEDLSGSDQPPFKGWFVPDRHSGFTGIDEPEFWQPFFSPQSATNEL